ncbi:hypothetical protein Ae201684P_008266 [Aphanomyces euteiches]|nr:hypothetical protein Ae201684P_008266 [Aphanomyces euteiches]KAH9153125.1 hypothetical protein AeRB84_004572 [Aphanomyces euteiches]
MYSRQQMPDHTFQATYEFYAETVVDYRDLPAGFTFQDIDSVFHRGPPHKNERPPSRPPTRSTGKKNSVSNIVSSVVTLLSLFVLLVGVSVSAAKCIAARHGPLSPLEELRREESAIDTYLYYMYPRCTGYNTKCTLKPQEPGSPQFACWTTWTSCEPPAWAPRSMKGQITPERLREVYKKFSVARGN